MKTFMISLNIIGIAIGVAGAVVSWESNPKASMWAITSVLWSFNALVHLLRREDLNG